MLVMDDLLLFGFTQPVSPAAHLLCSRPMNETNRQTRRMSSGHWRWKAGGLPCRPFVESTVIFCMRST